MLKGVKQYKLSISIYIVYIKIYNTIKVLNRRATRDSVNINNWFSSFHI